jgi:nitronate monooxygenase
VRVCIGAVCAAGILVVYQVGSTKEAETAQRAGAHILIAQGVEAGGHVRGTTPLKRLLSEVIASSDVPVLASGGIVDGRDLADALSSGADGVVIGTAFLASPESFAHDYHKERIVTARSQETFLTDMFHINWPIGAPVSRATEQRHAGSTRRSVRSEVRHR